MLSAPSSDEQYFLSIDWCASLIQSGKYVISVPYSRRYKAGTTEDAYFGNTLNNKDTIPACLILYPKAILLKRTQIRESKCMPSALPHYPSHQPLYSPTGTSQASQKGSQSTGHGLSTTSSFLFPIPSLQVLVALEHGVNAYPNLSHGGLIATLLDESMGMLLTLNGTLDEERRVRLPSGASTSSELTDAMNNAHVADHGGISKNSNRNSIDMKDTPKSHADPTAVHDTPQKDLNQCSEGQRSVILMSEPGTRIKKSSPSISAVTKELRIQYRQPVRTPAVVIIDVTFAAQMETEVSLEAPATGKEHPKSHNSNRDAHSYRGVIASTKQHPAVTSAAILSLSVGDPQRNNKRRDFFMRAIMKDRHHGRVLAVGDAVFTMPKSESKHESNSSTNLRSRL